VFVVGGWGSFFRCRGGGRRRRNRGGLRRVGSVVIYSLLPRELPTKIFRRWFWQWRGHVTVRRSRFESFDNSIGKSARKNFQVIDLLFFFKILNSPLAILSVYTDIISPSIYTNRITEGFASVGKYHRKLPTEKFCW
jgi:hypothetical protein